MIDLNRRATNPDILIVGLTGSIGMGKSTIAAMFREHAIPVCDADAEVHRLYAGAAVAPIDAAFPGTARDGSIDRQVLAARLLADPSGFKTLEAIVHPLVQAAERDFLRKAAAGGEKIAVLEIPLLFESGGAGRVDVIVVVSAPWDIQRERVLARPGMSEAKLAGILARQLPDADKREKADFVVDTGGTIAESRRGVATVLDALRGRRGMAFARHWA